MSVQHTWSNEAPICPYCEHVQQHDSGAYYDESLTETDCGDCGKVFSISVSHSTSWTCESIESGQDNQTICQGAEPFPKPQFKHGKEPCGECHLPAGETCDICGARREREI